MLPLSLVAAIHLTVAAHGWYDRQCCEDTHCRPVMCREIVPVGDGWKWRNVTFSRVQLKKSQDGDCHVCTQHDGSGPEQGLCIYLPPQS